MTEPSTDLARIVGSFPDHRTLGRALQDGVNAEMLAWRERRGEVHSPEDMYATVRWMQDTAEKFADYGLAFAGAAKLIGQYVEETLIDAVGEQDGVPTSNLTVPAVDGDISLAVDKANQYEIDPDVVFSALAFAVLESTDLHNAVLRLLGGGDVFDFGMMDGAEITALHEQLDTTLAGALTEAMHALTTLGKFELQVSKVRALAVQLARNGADGVSATVTQAISKKTAYRGVKMTRKRS